MSQHDELITLLKSLLTEQFSPKPHYIKAVLGDGLGNVTVPDRPDLSYVRFSRNSVTSFEIFNRAVNPVNDWPVLVGELPWQPGLTQVICTDWMTYEKSGWGDNMGDTSPHAPTHEWPDGSPGSDPVNVYTRAIVQGRGYVTTTTPTTVYVNQFDYGTGSQWPGLPGVDLAPLMSSMATGTMRYAGVYVDTATNTLGVVTGASTVYTPALDPPGMAFPVGAVPILRARVYGGQAAITEADIRDARQFLGNLTAGGTGGGDFSLAGDSGPAQTISAGDTLTVAGGDGLASVAGATDAVTVNLDIPGLTAEATADDADELIIYDNTASAHRRMTRANLLAGITGLTGEVWLISGQTVTTHTTIAAAVTAAAAGDTLIIWNGTYTETVTINKALRIIGMGAVVTYGAGITTLDITASGVWVVDLQVTNTYSPATSAGITAVKVAASLTGVRLERVVATAGSVGANTSDIYSGCWTLSAIETDDCEFTGGKGVSAIGLRVGSGSEAISPLIRRGKAMGAGGDYSNFGLYNNTASGYGAELRDVRASGVGGTVAADVMALAGTVTLLDPFLVSGTVNDNSGAGVVRGWYFGPDGALNSLTTAGKLTVASVTTSKVFDVGLYDAANTSGIASHFLDNDSSYPAGWTETDAAAAVNTSQLLSYWYLQNTSASTTWDYSIQSTITLESTGANSWQSFMLGPLRARDGAFAADVDYYFGIYGDNAGALDLDIYTRVHLQWYSAGPYWRVRGQKKDGTTAVDGTWYNLASPLVQPAYLRAVVRNLAAKTVRAYLGYAPHDNTAPVDFLLMDLSCAATWGQLWLRIHSSRGAGINDHLLIGAVDYISGAA